jgi:hypothetical protein
MNESGGGFSSNRILGLQEAQVAQLASPRPLTHYSVGSLLYFIYSNDDT